MGGPREARNDDPGGLATVVDDGPRPTGDRRWWLARAVTGPDAPSVEDEVDTPPDALGLGSSPMTGSDAPGFQVAKQGIAAVVRSS